MITSIKLISILFIFLYAAGISGQDNSEKLDSKYKEDIVEKICALLNSKYVFAERVEEICNSLKSDIRSEKIDTVSVPQEFAVLLTERIQSASSDLHFKIKYSKGSGKKLSESDDSKPDPEQEKRFLKAIKFENFGFKVARRLNGNVGYIDVTQFLDPKYGRETFASAISFLQYSNAIIIDVRMNGGGDPACVQLLCSYFFGASPVHLNDIYDRLKNETKEYWTLEELAGVRLPDVPLYVLTSDYTFSAAEEFAYDLQCLNRAIIVGDTTRGGAHPGATFPVDDDFTIFIPTGRAINPVTKSNWDGTGVIPDVAVSSEIALAKAHILALNTAIEKSPDETDKKYYKFVAETIETEMNASGLCASELKIFEGTYSGRKITFSSGKLFYQYGRRPMMEMIPVSEDTFALPDLDYVRLKFNKDNDGRFVSMTEIADTGDNETLSRTQ